jgi:hypothetical protein
VPYPSPNNLLLLGSLHRGEAELSGCWVKLLVLGLALLFLGKQETVEPTLEVSHLCVAVTASVCVCCCTVLMSYRR